MDYATRTPRAVPAWVPEDVRNYVFHTEHGQPIRALARSQSCHASTILRQVRKVEQRRDDPLVDLAIKALAGDGGSAEVPAKLEIMQALRRLAMPDTMLAIALGMEQGVVLRDTLQGGSDQGTKLPTTTAMWLALRGWIAPGRNTAARVLRYRITPAGRTALRELTAQSENYARAMAEAPAHFEGPKGREGMWDAPAAVMRMQTHDSPVQGLARRKDRDGKPFLSRTMVRAAERLREDFEIARVGQVTAENWQEVLRDATCPKRAHERGAAARAQIKGVFDFLGPGLAEVALRCCCLLEGLETTEKHMGWAARSGKVVLRIALQRLVLYYEDAGGLGPKIG